MTGDMQRQGTWIGDRNGIEEGDRDRGQWTGDWRQGTEASDRVRDRDKERNWDKGEKAERRVLYAEYPFVSSIPPSPPSPSHFATVVRV